MMDLVVSLRRLALDVLARLGFLPPLLARLVIGFVFVRSGWGKLHNLPQVTQFFESLGIPFASLQAPFVAGTELVCGALVLAGLATRFAAVPLIGTMLVAIATALWPDVHGLGDLFGLSEFLYILLLLQLVIGGPGALACDALIARRLDAEQTPLHRHSQHRPGGAQHARGTV